VSVQSLLVVISNLILYGDVQLLDVRKHLLTTFLGLFNLIHLSQLMVDIA
jgi:hypothetical protein